MVSEKATPKIAFIFDDRLSHDRKMVFSRVITILKAKYHFEVLSSSFTEKDLIDHLKEHEYAMILLPWHKYLSWKKIESHFGSMRLQGPTVAGYFADAVLPFELSHMPPFNRMILLDLYRFDQFEMEMVLGALIPPSKRSGFTGIFQKNTPIYFSDWFDYDSSSTRCIDAVMNSSLLHSSQWNQRAHSLRLSLTSLWSLCFSNRRSYPNNTPCAFLEIAEHHKCLVVKLAFESSELTLKNVMECLWPNGEKRHESISELKKHTDFLRVQFFPESHTIEITAFYMHEAPVIHFPGEVRGFWIEPLKNNFVQSAEADHFMKRQPLSRSSEEQVTDQLHEVLERLRALHSVVKPFNADERTTFDHQVANIRFIIQEIEKKVAERKKAA